MSAPARALAVVLAVAGLAFAAAGLVREVVLAADGSRRWRLPAPWEHAAGGWPLWLAAGLTTLAAILLLVLAVRELRLATRGPLVIQYGGEDGHARLDVEGLQRGLCGRLQRDVPGLVACRLHLVKGGEGWLARLEAEQTVADALALRARAFELAGEDLAHMTGLRLERLDLVVRRISVVPPATLRQNEDLGITRSS